VCMCAESSSSSSVNVELLINVSCVSWLDVPGPGQQRSKLSVWINWQLPGAAVTRRWRSVIEVINVDRRTTTHLDYIAETDSDHKRLDLPVNQLFHIRVCLNGAK